jgi:hypothetical protein
LAAGPQHLPNLLFLNFPLCQNLSDFHDSEISVWNTNLLSLFLVSDFLEIEPKTRVEVVVVYWGSPLRKNLPGESEEEDREEERLWRGKELG